MSGKKTKCKLEAIALLFITFMGIILFTSIPIGILETETLRPPNYIHIIARINCFGFEKVTIEGINGGKILDSTNIYPPSNWEKPYPILTWLLFLFGSILSLLGGFYYLNDNLKLTHIPIPRKLLFLFLGLIGGISMLIGPLFVINWLLEFPHQRLGVGFYFGISTGILTIIMTIILFIYRTKNGKRWILDYN